MQAYEYKVIPAPMKGEKERGLKTGAERFAHGLTLQMNEMAKDGWEYWRAETLPAEERSGLTSKVTVYHNLLVFRSRVNAAAGAGGLPVVDLGESAAAERRPRETRAEDPATSDFRSTRQIRTESPQGAAPKLGSAFGILLRA